MVGNRILFTGIVAGLLAGGAFASDGTGNLSLTATSCNPEVGATVRFALAGHPGSTFTLRAGQPGGSYVPGIGPVDLVMPNSTVIASGTIPASGVANLTVSVSYPDLTDVVFQGFAPDSASPTGTAVSNPARVEINTNPSMTFSTQTGLLPTLPALNGNKTVCGDVDGDGDLDVYVPTVGLPLSSSMEAQNLLLLNNGAGVYTDVTATNLPAILEATNRALLVDIDGDFDLDIVTANGQRSVSSPYPTVSRIYRNDGTGHFPTSAELPGGADYINDIAAGDVDGDGDVDLVLGRDGNGQGAPERLLINNGAGVFTDGTTPPTGGNNSNGGGGGGHGHGPNGGGGTNGGTTGGSGVTGIHPDRRQDDRGPARRRRRRRRLGPRHGERRRDGRARLPERRPRSLQAQVGAFSSADTGYANDAAFGDLDGDGDVDAVFVIRTLVLPLVREVRVLVNNGQGTYSRLSNGVTGLPVNDQVWNVALGDEDGDGDLDAVIVTTSQALDWMLSNDGTGHFSALRAASRLPTGRPRPSSSTPTATTSWTRSTRRPRWPGRCASCCASSPDRSPAKEKGRRACAAPCRFGPAPGRLVQRAGAGLVPRGDLRRQGLEGAGVVGVDHRLPQLGGVPDVRARDGVGQARRVVQETGDPVASELEGPAAAEGDRLPHREGRRQTAHARRQAEERVEVRRGGEPGRGRDRIRGAVPTGLVVPPVARRAALRRSRRWCRVAVPVLLVTVPEHGRPASPVAVTVFVYEPGALLNVQLQLAEAPGARLPIAAGLQRLPVTTTLSMVTVRSS
jgi:hypothetical protein